MFFRLNFDGRVSQTLKLPDYRQRRGYFDLVNASFAGRRFVNSLPGTPKLTRRTESALLGHANRVAN
jgi:hypothetical protein